MRVQIENIAEERRKRGIDTTGLDREIAALGPGDHVKLSFRTAGVEVPELLAECREEGHPYPVGESMWVELTRVEGEYPDATYHGELDNRPFFIDLRELAIGCPLSFTKDFIHSIHP
jgi:hypothetical protein